jgi:rare lipoprotein A
MSEGRPVSEPRVRLAGALLVVLALAACSGAPVRRAPGATPAAGVPLPTSRQGGYYGDDGPGDSPPADLAAIADATPRREPLLARANRPYVVFGRQYVPMNELVPYRERGVASWYGRKFHGQRTSSGEVYDMYGMTAAHPTLPIPSYVRVTGVRSGNAVVVRVNDRGPFLNGRLIDLSYTAAAKLGYVNAGSAEVEVELLTRFEGTDAAPVQMAARPAIADVDKARGARAPVESAESIESIIAADAAASPTGGSAASEQSATAVSPYPRGLFVQLGAFASRDNAEAARQRLAGLLDWLAARIEVRQEGSRYKVQAGPFAQRAEAQATVERIRLATDMQVFATGRP